MVCVPRRFVLGTPALTRDARLYGDALSVAVKPGSDHLVPCSRYTVHDDPEQDPPLFRSVSTGYVVSRQTRLVDGDAPPAPLHGDVSVIPVAHRPVHV
jgi:hypothetical protein